MNTLEVSTRAITADTNPTSEIPVATTFYIDDDVFAALDCGAEDRCKRCPEASATGTWTPQSLLGSRDSSARDAIVRDLARSDD